MKKTQVILNYQTLNQSRHSNEKERMERAENERMESKISNGYKSKKQGGSKKNYQRIF